MMKYGYARVSTSEQDLTIQIEALTNAGCETIRQEKVSGVSVQGRDELNTLLEFLREGDELVVTRVDRLARSIRDLQNIVYDLDKKGVVLSATEQPIDTRTSAGKCFGASILATAKAMPSVCGVGCCGSPGTYFAANKCRSLCTGGMVRDPVTVFEMVVLCNKVASVTQTYGTFCCSADLRPSTQVRQQVVT